LVDSTDIATIARQFWPESAFNDEQSLQAHLAAIIHEIHDRLEVDSTQGLESRLELYRWAESRCRHEPLATPYEHGLMQINAMLAENHALEGNWEPVYRSAEEIFHCLSLGDERRSRLDMPPRPNSELRYRLCTLLALAKWAGPTQDRDRLLTPLEVRNIYLQAAEKALTYIIASNPSPERAAMVREAVAISGVQVACMLYREFHASQPMLPIGHVSWFNKRFGPHLASDPGHFRKHRPLADSWYYWHYELVKLWATGSLTQDDLAYCHQKRLECLPNTMSNVRPVQGFMREWEREVSMMTGQLADALQSRVDMAKT
jgi:hypothetical protein